MTFFAPPGNKDAIAIYISFIFVLSLFLLTLFWDYVKDIIIGLFESNTPSITKDKLIMKKKLPAINLNYKKTKSDLFYRLLKNFL